MFKKKYFLILFIWIFFYNSILFSFAKTIEDNQKYKITISDNKNLLSKEYDDYNCIHNLYFDIFCTLDLTNITLNEKIKIINIINSYLKGDYKIDLYIKKYKFNKDLKISLYEPYVMAKDGYNNILLITNYDLQNKKVINENESKENVYAKIYEIKNSLFVEMYSIFDEKKEKEYKDKNNKNSLADLYLFDEIQDNDLTIEDLLKQDIIENDQNLFSYFTLVEYFLSKRDFIKAEEVLNESKKAKNKNEKSSNWIKEEFEITKSILKK
jgi:hypothetical protein